MGCIYQIKNTVTGGTYIGSARNTKHRWNDHQKHLREQRHHSIYLQRAWNKYGSDSFEFSVIEVVDDNTLLLEREQWHMDQRSGLPKRMVYNVCPTAGSRMGAVVSKEGRRRISLAHIGMPISAEARIKQADTWVERYGKTYRLKSPDGIVYENITNLRRFAKEHGVLPQSLRTVVIGIQNVSNGWSLPDYVPVIYIVTSPSGERFTNIRDLKKFCISNGVDYKQMHGALQRGHKHKGWSVSTANNNRRRKGKVR